MKKQIEMLESLIGKCLGSIYCQGISHKPLPNVNNEYLTYEKMSLIFSGEDDFTLEGITVDYPNHHNPFKLKIARESVYFSINENSSQRKQSYSSEFEVGFEIGSIYIYEDDLRWDVPPNFEHLNEIKEKETLGSTLILNDTTGLRNIMISCYEVPAECMDVETKIEFRMGNMFTEFNMENGGKRKFVAKIGNAPEEQ